VVSTLAFDFQSGVLSEVSDRTIVKHGLGCRRDGLPIDAKYRR